jgi:predicted secreted protein
VAKYLFSEKDNGASTEVRRGASITVELKESPTTGYRWLISNIDEAFLRPEGDEFITPTEKTPGAGGQRKFFFRAKSEGSTKLTLINKRAWQRDEKAVGTFNLIIRIFN